MPDDPLAPEPGVNAAPPAMGASTLGRIAVRATFWTSLGTYLNQIIGFVATLLITRLLNPEVFGFFSLATFWFTLLNLRTKSGIHYSAIRRPESNGDLLGTYWGLDVALALGSIALSVCIGFVLLQLHYATPVVVGIVVLMLADGLTTIVGPLAIVLEREIQISRLTLVAVAASCFSYTTAIVLALNGAGIGALLAVNLVTSLVAIAGIYLVCRRRYPQVFQWPWRFDKKLARHLVRDGLPTGLSLTALSSIVMQFDNFLIGTFVGATTLGYYDRAYRIASWSNILLTTIISYIGFLTFSKVRDDPARLTQAVRLALWILLTLGIPIALVLFFGAPDVVQIFYTSKYAESAYFLRFLTIYSVLWPLASLGFWLAVAQGNHRQAVLMTSGQAATIILLGTLLTLWLGVNGTLLAVATTMVIAFSLSCAYIFRQVPLSPRNVFGAHAIALLVASLVLVLAFQVPAWNELQPLGRVTLISLLGSGVFLLTLFILRPGETRERISYVWQRFRIARNAV